MEFARLRPLAWSVAMLVGGCGASDPDAEIRAVLAAAETAVEARDTSFFRDFVGSGYRDSRGNDRERLLGTIRGFFLANQRIEIVSRVDEVRFEGEDAAKVVLHAGLIGQHGGAALLGGLDAGLYRFEIELVADGGDWRMIGAKWERAAGESR
jgi:hypothetical protein